MYVKSKKETITFASFTKIMNKNNDNNFIILFFLNIDVFTIIVSEI